MARLKAEEERVERARLEEMARLKAEEERVERARQAEIVHLKEEERIRAEEEANQGLEHFSSSDEEENQEHFDDVTGSNTSSDESEEGEDAEEEAEEGEGATVALPKGKPEQPGVNKHIRFDSPTPSANESSDAGGRDTEVIETEIVYGIFFDLPLNYSLILYTEFKAVVVKKSHEHMINVSGLPVQKVNVLSAYKPIVHKDCYSAEKPILMKLMTYMKTHESEEAERPVEQVRIESEKEQKRKREKAKQMRDREEKKMREMEERERQEREERARKEEEMRRLEDEAMHETKLSSSSDVEESEEEQEHRDAGSSSSSDSEENDEGEGVAAALPQGELEQPRVNRHIRFNTPTPSANTSSDFGDRETKELTVQNAKALQNVIASMKKDEVSTSHDSQAMIPLNVTIDYVTQNAINALGDRLLQKVASFSSEFNSKATEVAESITSSLVGFNYCYDFEIRRVGDAVEDLLKMYEAKLMSMPHAQEQRQKKMDATLCAEASKRRRLDDEEDPDLFDPQNRQEGERHSTAAPSTLPRAATSASVLRQQAPASSRQRSQDAQAHADAIRKGKLPAALS
ncbi:histone-lysine N-methyltransferase, H3 lysine-79 specific-like [Cynara cardunculus var. scolymus]|uniref:histone-lysine N-methyltransferase, H3 lysine-79 specific-like n=1 Tax=Cynara cardunculus var. scolymus TaxID=59895 RepID=UPI000D630150|nr:histone-lysine N-methyltransferase, H3 lysine-79 specific-like [Cynara cardunculus var. scolymus]